MSAHSPHHNDSEVMHNITKSSKPTHSIRALTHLWTRHPLDKQQTLPTTTGKLHASGGSRTSSPATRRCKARYPHTRCLAQEHGRLTRRMVGSCKRLHSCFCPLLCLDRPGREHESLSTEDMPSIVVVVLVGVVFDMQEGGEPRCMDVVDGSSSGACMARRDVARRHAVSRRVESSRVESRRVKSSGSSCVVSPPGHLENIVALRTTHEPAGEPLFEKRHHRRAKTDGTSLAESLVSWSKVMKSLPSFTYIHAPDYCTHTQSHLQ